MTHKPLRLSTLVSSLMASAGVFAAGAPVDDLPGIHEEPLLHYITSCSTVTTPGLRVCQEGDLDLNEDGNTDLIVGLNQQAAKLFYSGNGDGTFDERVFFGGLSTTSALKIADLDGDGDLDMVESTRGTGPGGTGGTRIYVNNGTNAAPFFNNSVQTIDSRRDRSGSVAVGDLDNDGDLDIVIGNETTGAGGNPGLAPNQHNLIYLNQDNAGTPNVIEFGTAQVLDPPGSESYTRRVVLIDIEGDGDLDIVATSASGQADGLGTGNVLYVNRTANGGGAGVFDAPIRLKALTGDPLIDNVEANGVGAGDIDGDGDADLVFSVWQGRARYYINNSTGGGPNFETTDTFGPSVQNSSVRLADVDNDGDLDALVTEYEVSAAGGGRLHLNLSDDGTGVFQAIALPIVYPTLPNLAFDRSRHIDVGDLDADGWLDLVITNRDQRNLRFLNNDECAGPGNACNPFANVVPDVVTAPGLLHLTIPGDAPYDLATAMDVLTVEDNDNVYPVDFTLQLSPPLSNDQYTCTGIPPGPSCTDAVITPNPGYRGLLTVDLKVRDGQRTSSSFVLRVDVGESNAPRFTSTPVLTVAQGATYTYNVVATDTDGGDLDIEATVKPAWLTLTAAGPATATLSGTPGPTDVGSHPVTLQVTDGENHVGIPQSFTVTVTDVNDAPSITSTPVTAATEGQPYSYLVTASDPDTGDTLNITAAALPSWLTLNATGNGTATLAGTPMGGDVGPHDVSLTVSDLGLLSSAPQAFTITVVAAGEGPTITLNGANPLIVVLGSAFTDPGATASDAQDGDLTAQITATGDVDTATAGDYTRTYSVQDSAGNPAQTQRLVRVVALGGGNEPPAITSPGPQAATVGQAFSLDVAGNASDPNGDPLSFTATGLPAGLSISSAGLISGSPTTAAGSPLTVTVTVSDGSAQANASFELTVQQPANRPPAITAPVAQSATVGTNYTLSLAGSASDPDGDSLTFSASGLPPGISVSAAGLVSGAPTSAAGSPFTVTVTVSDGKGGQASANFQLTVSNPTSGGGGDGGGGSVGLVELLSMLGIGALVARRRRPQIEAAK